MTAFRKGLNETWCRLRMRARGRDGGNRERSGSASADDTRFIRMALDEARQGDFPFGAVIVRDGSVIARGRNLGRTTDDPTAHGEMVERKGPAEAGPSVRG